MKNLLTVLVALAMLLTLGCDGEKAKDAADKAKAAAAGQGPEAICNHAWSKASEEEKKEKPEEAFKKECTTGLSGLQEIATKESFTAFGACAMKASSEDEFKGCAKNIVPKPKAAPEASK